MSTWPQHLMIIILVMNVIVGFVFDGTPRKPFNAGYMAGDAIIFAFILWCGGFWSALK